MSRDRERPPLAFVLPPAQAPPIYRQPLRMPPNIMSTQSAIMIRGKSHAYSIDGHLLFRDLRREGVRESYKDLSGSPAGAAGRGAGAQQSGELGLQDSTLR
jgi:hypothetical protein